KLSFFSPVRRSLRHGVSTVTSPLAGEQMILCPHCEKLFHKWQGNKGISTAAASPSGKVSLPLLPVSLRASRRYVAELEQEIGRASKHYVSSFTQSVSSQGSRPAVDGSSASSPEYYHAGPQLYRIRMQTG